MIPKSKTILEAVARYIQERETAIPCEHERGNKEACFRAHLLRADSLILHLKDDYGIILTLFDDMPNGGLGDPRQKSG